MSAYLNNAYTPLNNLVSLYCDTITDGVATLESGNITNAQTVSCQSLVVNGTSITASGVVGATGPTGPAGSTPNFSILSTTTLSSTTPAYVNINNTNPLYPTLAFGIPQGIQGPQGPQGNAGSNGSDGAKGDKGDTGDTGPSGGPDLASLAVATSALALATANTVAITAVGVSVATLEGEVLAIQGQIGAIDTSIATINGDITAINNDITVLTNQTQNISSSTTVGQTDLTGSMTASGTITATTLDATSINATVINTTTLQPSLGVLYVGGTVINIGNPGGGSSINLIGSVNFLNSDVFKLSEFIDQIG
jgi:hypothetical protein